MGEWHLSFLTEEAIGILNVTFVWQGYVNY